MIRFQEKLVKRSDLPASSYPTEKSFLERHTHTEIGRIFPPQNQIKNSYLPHIMGSGPISALVIGAKKWYQREESYASTFPWKIPAGGRGETKGRVLPRRAGTLLSPSFSSLAALTQTWPSTTAEVTPALVWKEHFGGWWQGSQVVRATKLHLSRPETIHTPLLSQSGRWQTLHTFRILICKALLQALPSGCKWTICWPNSRATRGWASWAACLDRPTVLCKSSFCCIFLGLYFLELHTLHWAHMFSFISMAPILPLSPSMITTEAFQWSLLPLTSHSF